VQGTGNMDDMMRAYSVLGMDFICLAEQGIAQTTTHGVLSASRPIVILSSENPHANRRKGASEGGADVRRIKSRCIFQACCSFIRQAPRARWRSTRSAPE
jgi:hypothetical protein